MDVILKWIGGGTVVAALVLAGVAVGGRATAEAETPDVVAAAPEPAVEPVEVHGALAAKAVADAKRLYTVRRILPIDGPIKYGEWHWDDEGVPDGPLLVTVDLEARVISIFRGGYEIGAAAVMLGTDEHPTPTGVFPILWKQRHNVSEKYGNAPMPWSMFLTTDGVAIHGGSVVENGYASHGCIGVPDDIAKRLFAIAKKGDKIVITRGEQMTVGDSII
ncbi:MAG: L,D-transpeptidase family protein [Erythrobacter sp.]|jgi:lipoprotein-anchoring transpeptidase ErfK/SrfK|uniref:L,D-transpeptidase family protein n=1 Tax=Qipengyuania citrea TaxID=225971 RepID=UPI0020A1B0EC|nr:L,D-transpeptidase family protein [Qipengyuania citrea]MCP2017318.1 lipoprotein-anchoring transpeptidase ErfK/SrfK [Qipengyuania citrea]MDE0901420.1 L,D-transpeptidase family protein [Erythrobacter sp.]